MIPAPDQKPEPNINKVGRIISHALGAGFGAMQKQAQATDQAAQGKAREDFEQEQQTKLRQLDIAKSNALNLSLHESNLLSQNERDTDRAQSKQIADAFRAMPGEEHDVREMSAEAAKAAIFDPNNQTWAHTHLVLPAGFDDVKDSSGNRLKDSDGNYKTEGRVYVIGGMKDGKVALPASIVSDIQKYKKYGDLANTPGLDGLKEGDEYEPKQFIRLYGALLSAKKEVVSGWGKPEAYEGPKGEILQRNTVTGDTKPATEEQADAYKMRKAKL
ncbi:MAG: hypothetical protein DMG49_21555, partial [Acidobacteria bacterium]